MKAAGRLFGLMLINYLLNAVSFRFLARGNYVGIAGADFMLAYWGFTMTRLVVKADTRLEQFAYATGGVVGSLAGMYITR